MSSADNTPPAVPPSTAAGDGAALPADDAMVRNTANLLDAVADDDPFMPSATRRTLRRYARALRALADRVEAMQRDAERLDWLQAEVYRRACVGEPDLSFTALVPNSDPAVYWCGAEEHSGYSVCEALDAARAASPTPDTTPEEG